VDEAAGGRYQALAQRFREAGLACEVFFEAKKLSAQFIAAEKKGIPWVIVPGETLTLREMATRQNREGLSFEDCLRILQGNAG
jgi:histidyl-tRNA synthetase